jgi:hypothetical protein
MRYLTILSNTDKHRLIVPALMSPQVGDVEFKFDPLLEYVKEIHHLSSKREIEVGTKIITFVLAGNVPPNQPRVHIDTKFTLMPMLSKSIVGLTPSRDIVLLEDALNLISTVCTEILLKAKEFF